MWHRSECSGPLHSRSIPWFLQHRFRGMDTQAARRSHRPAAVARKEIGNRVGLCTQCGASRLSGNVRDVQARDCGFDSRLRWTCSDVVLLGKALCSHDVHPLDPRVRGYLVGQWRLMCLNSPVHRKWQPGCMLPGELRWLMNEQVRLPAGNCVKSDD